MGASYVEIFEVGPRDGLQNESREVTFAQKLWLIRSLENTGLKNIEVGAFVRPDRVPQMADTDRIYAALKKKPLSKKTKSWALVANSKGLERAIAAGARNVAVFTAASESFCQSNIGMSIDQSLKAFDDLIAEALRKKIQVRGYVSTVFGCPFEGDVKSKVALRVAERLIKMGVCQVSLGDTIGVATHRKVDAIVPQALKNFGVDKVAVHFHDTYGVALVNTDRSIEHGVRTVDSSVGGLGGCPFAPGATGNLATEDLLFYLHGKGMKTGVDLELLSQASLKFARKIDRPLSSRYLQAFAASRSK